jgi:S1-C subfamily serine protease
MRKKILIVSVITYIVFSILLSVSQKAVASEVVNKTIHDNYRSSFMIYNYSVKGKSQGSGFILENFNDYIITNAHVVKGSEVLTTVYIDEKEYFLEVVDVSTEYDLAILKFRFDTPENIGYSRLCEHSKVKIKQKVYSIGHPAGIRYVYSDGYVNASKIDIKSNLFLSLHMDTIWGGASGSAVFDYKENCVLSVTTYKRTNVNTSYSLSVEYLNEYINNYRIKATKKTIIKNVKETIERIIS